MIFDLVISRIDGKAYARIPNWTWSENKDTDPFELVELLRAAFPERQYDFCVVCFAGYENAVSLG